MVGAIDVAVLGAGRAGTVPARTAAGTAGRLVSVRIRRDPGGAGDQADEAGRIMV